MWGELVKSVSFIQNGLGKKTGSRRKPLHGSSRKQTQLTGAGFDVIFMHIITPSKRAKQVSETISAL